MSSSKGYKSKGLSDYEKLLVSKKEQFKKFTTKRKVKKPKNIFTDTFA